jgi:hypothetical protein
MKLKRLMKMVKDIPGHSWLAIDKNGKAFSYTGCPHVPYKYDAYDELDHESWDYDGDYIDLQCKYTGKKDWRNTLRYIK